MNKLNLFKKFLTALIIVLSVSSCRRTGEDTSLEIGFEKYTLPNGLQVILHTDHSDPMISYAIMYHVGSSRETHGKTGFAHLFEHLLFGGSENVSSGTFDKIIESMGGSNNGFTTRDITTYYEVFPKNALEKVLWLESDRMGFFINSVTQRSLAIQQNVVQNEKRQGEDNSPYGFTDYVILKNLYPGDHPYSWEVIGEMEDLRNATLDDVKTYYENFYGPNNATLVLAGDFNSDSVKLLIDKYFGEIDSHGSVSQRTPVPVTLNKTVKLYHEDNFANVPEINLVWPAPKAFDKDAYALDFLAKILADGKKAPLYKVLVREKQLTSTTSAYNSSGELAGEFTITIRANEGKSLKDIEDAISESFRRFEEEGITENDIERVKASSEKNFYEGISSVFNKSIQLAFYNTYLNDPGFIEKDIENIKSVTLDDVINVYNKYIKDKPHIVTSFVPKGMLDVMAGNSVNAGIVEEDVNKASQVKISLTEDEAIAKTASSIDRSVEPPAGQDPEVSLPEIWKATLKNGIEISGIQNKELPLVVMTVIIEGGLLNDRIDLPGVSSLVAGVMPQGTAYMTPEELEEAIELLGSTISFSLGREELSINISSLARNFNKTVALVKDILLEPRWDTTEFALAKSRARNIIIQSEAQPRSVANLEFFKLLYGSDHIFGYNPRGTMESVDMITIDDLKEFYKKNFSPSVTSIQVSGNITKEQVISAMRPLEKEWLPADVRTSTYPVPENPQKSNIYFYDMPGSLQSVIYIGYLAITRDNPDYVKTDFINYRLGGAFTSILNQILREEKGFTYGASTSFGEMKTIAPFIATSSVRSDATYESVKIFKEEMEKYRKGISEDELQFIKNCMIRSNALRFETNESLVSMLAAIKKFGLPDDYVKRDEEVIKNMTVEEHKAVTEKYINPDKMYFVIVGDAASQLKPLEKIGFGKPVMLN